MWCNFKFEGVLFRSDSRHNDRVDSLLECATKQAVMTMAQWHRKQIIMGLWLLTKKKLKMDSCLCGGILNLKEKQRQIQIQKHMTCIYNFTDKKHLIYYQLNKPECILMTHLLSAVFKGVVML